MKRKLLLITIVLTLFVTHPVFAIDYTEDGDNPLSGGAQIPAGNHTFNNTGADLIITIDEGDLTVASGATITFVGIERLEIGDGRQFTCTGTSQNPIVFIGIADDPRPDNPREGDDGNPVTIRLLAGATGDIEWTTFEVFGIALEADPQSALDITNGTFTDCDVCILDQATGTELNTCTFTEFWTTAVHADGATQFIYENCDFNSADRESPLTGQLLAANHILCEDGDNTSFISECSFDQIQFRDEGVLRWMRASIHLNNTSTRILNSTFNYDEVNVAAPQEQLDISIEAAGNSDPFIKGCRTICDAKIRVIVNDGHTVTIDSCFFEVANATDQDCAIIIEDGFAQITNSYFVDCNTNIIFTDNDNAIPIGGSVSNCVLAYTGRFWIRDFEFTGITIVAPETDRLGDLDISNNIFLKEGMPPAMNAGYWHGIDMNLGEALVNDLAVKNNIFYDDNNLGQNWGEIICIEGTGVDFDDDYNHLFQFEAGERFDNIGNIGQDNTLDGDDPDFIEPPFTTLLFNI